MTDGGEDFNLGHVVGADGAKGDTGNGISSITKTSTSGKVDTYTITFTNGTTTTFQLTNGSDGAKGDKGDKGDTGNTGNGISSITKTGTSGLVDTYTITFTNNTTTTFTVTNGSDATVDIVTSWNSTTSDSKVPSEKLSKTSLDGKLDNAITSSAVSIASNDNILIADYSDSNKVKKVANVLASHIKDSSAHTHIGSSANATQDTINSAIDTALNGKQASLVSGTNIKTVNNESLLGSGNITIQGGSSVDVVTSWEATLSDSKVPSEKLVKNTIDGLSIPTKTSDLTNDGDGTNVFIKNNDSRLTDSRTPTSHTHGNLTNDGKVGSTANYFVYTTTGGAITSKQKIGNITTSGAIGSTANLPVITTTSGVLTTGSFGTGSGTFAEGNHTHSGYISTSSTVGLVKNDGSIDTTSYLTSSAISGMLTTSDIADNLTTNDSTKVLSAKQGKVLNDLIGQAIAYINQ